MAWFNVILSVWSCQLYRLSSIVWCGVLGILPTNLLDLFILTSACSGQQSLHSASTAIKQHRAFSTVGSFAWNLVFHLSPIFHGIVQLHLQAP